LNWGVAELVSVWRGSCPRYLFNPSRHPSLSRLYHPVTYRAFCRNFLACFTKCERRCDAGLRSYKLTCVADCGVVTPQPQPQGPQSFVQRGLMTTQRAPWLFISQHQPTSSHPNRCASAVLSQIFSPSPKAAYRG